MALRFTQTVLKYLPYEYKLRRYRQRRVKKEEEEREVEDLERFSSYVGKKTEEKEIPTQNVVVRRHLRKKEIEYKVRKNAIDADKSKEEIGAYVVEVKEVKEDRAKTTYTLDVVEWEKEIEKDARKGEIENKLLLDQDFDVEKWEEGIVYDDRIYAANRTDLHLVVDANDRNLLFDIVEKDEGKEKKSKRRKQGAGKALGGKYNISGDKNYSEVNESLKSALGIHGVQHSVPALKLAPELYKTYMTREELRFFHRPVLHLPPLSEIRFQSLIENTAKPSSIIKKKKELTLRDSAEFVLLEYSEEIPPLIANVGMASIITTFCRKAPGKDALPGEPEIGGITALDTKDPSPFMFIGDVQPGESVSAVVNNLYKAPIFFHSTGDLLAVWVKGEKPGYYVRTIESLACVGQTLPMEEAFSPHSRRYNVFCKNRLKVAAYRIFYEKGNKDRKMHINQLDSIFPHFSEGSKRKWLKEYAECIKKGKDNLWMLKASAALLSEDDLRRAVTPEQVCQYESMLAEERRLKDAGVALAATEEEGIEEEELKLAVWNMTRNFTNAASGKGMLELAGPGDPTGIGEGFSFLRVKKREKEEDGEVEKKSFTEHMKQYKEEAKKIWDLQMAALSNRRSPVVNWLESESDASMQMPAVQRAQRKPAPETKSGKMLSITRLVVRNGEHQQETEIVTDARVIEAYMKARKRQKREETRTSLRCGSCGQVGHMKTNKTCMNYKGKLVERKEKKKSASALLSDIILSVVKDLFGVPFSVAFHRAVSVKKFPNYLEFVKNPMDLTTVKAKARNQEYKSYEEFLSDIRLISANCNTYNGAAHSLTKISQDMIEIASAAYEKNRSTIQILEGKSAE